MQQKLQQKLAAESSCANCSAIVQITELKVRRLVSRMQGRLVWSLAGIEYKLSEKFEVNQNDSKLLELGGHRNDLGPNTSNYGIPEFGSSDKSVWAWNLRYLQIAIDSFLVSWIVLNAVLFSPQFPQFLSMTSKFICMLDIYRFTSTPCHGWILLWWIWYRQWLRVCFWAHPSTSFLAWWEEMLAMWGEL